MAVYETGFETGVTWGTTVGSPTISTERPRTGANSLRVSGGNSYIQHDCSTSDTAPWQIRAYVNIASRPSSGNRTILQWLDSDNAEEIGIRLNSAGRMRASHTGSVIGSASAVLPLNTWHELILIVNTFGNGCEAYLNGALLGSVASSNIGENSRRLRAGAITAAPGMLIYIDDVEVAQDGLSEPVTSVDLDVDGT